MIVVDTNIVGYLLIEGDKTFDAQQVREKDPVWRVPPLWKYEFTNVLSMYVRNRKMPEVQAVRLLDMAVQLLGPAEIKIDPAIALQLTFEYKISGYDAQYLALAKQLDVPCVTEDKQFQRASADHTQTMRQFLS